MQSNKPRNFILHEKKPAECSLTLSHIGHTRTKWMFQTCGSIAIDLLTGAQPGGVICPPRNFQNILQKF